MSKKSISAAQARADEEYRQLKATLQSLFQGELDVEVYRYTRWESSLHPYICSFCIPAYIPVRVYLVDGTPVLGRDDTPVEERKELSDNSVRELLVRDVNYVARKKTVIRRGT